MPYEREVLLGEFVIGELEIVGFNAHKGYWKLSFDPSEKAGYSRKPEL